MQINAHKILVIDDEPDLELLITQKFRKEIDEDVYHFEFAENGLDGLEKITDNSGFEVIFTDLKMPVMDGLTFLKRLKEKGTLAKAIVISAYDDIENIRSAMNTGAFDFIVKPISFNDLKLTLQKALLEYDNQVKGIEALKKLIEAEKQKEAAILKERLQISRDLHDDIGATLSSISVYSVAAKQRLKNNQINEANTILDNISIDAQEMVNTMSDMVWLINPQKDKMENLFDRIQSFVSNILSAKNILLDFKVDETLKSMKLNMEARKNIFLIIKEAVNNIAKYSACSEVKISVQKQEEELNLTISDNGKGFDVERKNNTGNGLQNMKQRAEMLSGKLDIHSKPGSGTSVYFISPLINLS